MDFLDRTLENFREYLKENTESKNTVKNYVSDLRIFLIFLDSRHSPITAENFPHFLNQQTLADFSQYLSVINPPATLNRRISSVKKFFDYYLEHHPLPVSVHSPPPITFSSTTHPDQPAEIIDLPSPEPNISPSPDPMPIQETAPSDNHDQLLRLLPEEITDSAGPSISAYSSVATPSGFIKQHLTQIISITAFLVGFLATMAIYPLLYP